MKSSDHPITYRQAGVDISAAEQALELIRPLVRATFTPQVLAELGTFGSLFAFPQGQYHSPVLVSSVDGVGTKLKVAAMTGRHRSVGGDLVHHCVNDILAQGARALFFMDYLAAGRLVPEVMAQVVEGMAAACQEVGCALIGGETAEMPGVYQEGDYDLVGFILGVVERDRVVTGERAAPGDVVIGLASDGMHTNGYSLARKLFFEIAGLQPDTFVPELDRTIGDELMRQHRCYAGAVLPALDEFEIRGMAHITGGGLPGNLVRTLPEGCRAVLQRGSWQVPRIFRVIQSLGVPEEDMFRTFNMGVGFCLIAPADQAQALSSRLSALGETAYQIGRIEQGERGVEVG